MKKIISLGGSSSKQSINRQLAEYTAGLLKEADLIKLDLSTYEIPLFSVDYEKEHGYAKTITDLNAIFDKADGFIISLAEHNGAYATAFKNILDWLSRIQGKVWRDKPMILLSTSPGVRGGQSVLNIALDRFPRMGANIIGSLPFTSFNDNFKDNEVVDEVLRAKLNEMVVLFENKL